MIELYFGEDGYYPDKRIMEMFNLKPHEERPNEEQKLDNKIRGRRSIVDDINKVEPQLENLKRKVSILLEIFQTILLTLSMTLHC